MNVAFRPPSDTKVLLGFCHGEEHAAWIAAHGLYNLRADPERDGAVGLSSPELGADLVDLYHRSWESPVTYRTDGTFCLRSAAQLSEAGYRDPGGTSYVCLGLADRLTDEGWTIQSILDLTRARTGREAAPMVVTLEQLMLANQA